MALRFRARRSCLPKRKQGHDTVLAPEFVNSKHLGQPLIQLCITSNWQAGQGYRSSLEYISVDYSLCDLQPPSRITQQAALTVDARNARAPRGEEPSLSDAQSVAGKYLLKSKKNKV